MKDMTDEKLYELCEMYGARALQWRSKFIGLLPEVERRRLYLKKGFSDVFEFAAKLAGVSQKQAQRVLQLETKFADKPILKEALTSGEISANKLAKIASIATVENQEILFNQSKLLNCRSLETLARDVRHGNDLDESVAQDENRNGLFERKNDDKSVHVNTLAKIENLIKLNLADEVVAKLSELREKGIDVSELILEFLEKRENEIEERKAKIVLEQALKAKDKVVVTRHIPVEVRKVLVEEHGTKCAVSNCKKLAETMHHTARFALVKEHNPYFMAPLCIEHHEIAHAIDLRVQRKK